jgi:hypothetical protein
MAEDAVACEPFSAVNSLLTGKNTGNFAAAVAPPRSNSPVKIELAVKTDFFRRIGTGNEQTRSRESQFPVKVPCRHLNPANDEMNQLRRRSALLARNSSRRQPETSTEGGHAATPADGDGRSSLILGGTCKNHSVYSD